MALRHVALVLALLSVPVPVSAEVRDLKAFFLERCTVCHGPDGSGRAPNGTRLGGRNLTEARWLAKQEEAALVTSVLRGRGAMPGFRHQLSETEVRQLLASILRPGATRKKP
jgi:mono/diheme cytochrome c family protein